MNIVMMVWIIVSPYTSGNTAGYPQDRFMYTNENSCVVALADRPALAKAKCVQVQIVRPG